MADYLYDQTLYAEQFNTLLMIDEIIGRENLPMQPSFEIVGGTALLFHGVQAMFTVDIDVANKLTDNIKDLVEPFISDAASEVVTLPSNYKQRLIPYCDDKFTHIRVYLISLEDLIVSKLAAGRVKDNEDLTKTDVMTMCDYGKLTKIINEELEISIASRLLSKIATMY